MDNFVLLGQHGFAGMRRLKKEELSIQIHWYKFARQHLGRRVLVAVEVLSFNSSYEWRGYFKNKKPIKFVLAN